MSNPDAAVHNVPTLDVTCTGEGRTWALEDPVREVASGEPRDRPSMLWPEHASWGQP